MELYSYKAMDADGNIVRGRLDAQNVGDLEHRLSRLGLDLVNYREVGSGVHLVTGRGIKRIDLINFCFHLEQLLEAGVPILEGLADLRDSVDNRRLREVTSVMIDLIEGGKSLSEAMRDFPYVFSSVFVNLIKAGEDSGQLIQVLRNVLENLKWQDEQTAHTKKLVLYPAFVACVITGVLFFLMMYVVPELLRFVTTMGQELPLHTRALIFLSSRPW
jgi:type IV pilus assembly protein PilC